MPRALCTGAATNRRACTSERFTRMNHQPRTGPRQRGSRYESSRTSLSTRSPVGDQPARHLEGEDAAEREPDQRVRAVRLHRPRALQRRGCHVVDGRVGLQPAVEHPRAHRVHRPVARHRIGEHRVRQHVAGRVMQHEHRPLVGIARLQQDEGVARVLRGTVDVLGERIRAWRGKDCRHRQVVAEPFVDQPGGEGERKGRAAEIEEAVVRSDLRNAEQVRRRSRRARSPCHRRCRQPGCSSLRLAAATSVVEALAGSAALRHCAPVAR